MAFLVISWNTMRFVFSGVSPSSVNRCQLMASPSRSSSDANQTMSAFFTSLLRLLTSFSFSAGISYSGSNVSVFILNSFFFKSQMCP